MSRSELKDNDIEGPLSNGGGPVSPATDSVLSSSESGDATSSPAGERGPAVTTSFNGQTHAEDSPSSPFSDLYSSSDLDEDYGKRDPDDEPGGNDGDDDDDDDDDNDEDDDDGDQDGDDEYSPAAVLPEVLEAVLERYNSVLDVIEQTTDELQRLEAPMMRRLARPARLDHLRNIASGTRLEFFHDVLRDLEAVLVDAPQEYVAFVVDLLDRRCQSLRAAPAQPRPGFAINIAAIDDDNDDRRRRRRRHHHHSRRRDSIWLQHDDDDDDDDADGRHLGDEESRQYTNISEPLGVGVGVGDGGRIPRVRAFPVELDDLFLSDSDEDDGDSFDDEEEDDDEEEEEYDEYEDDELCDLGSDGWGDVAYEHPPSPPSSLELTTGDISYSINNRDRTGDRPR